MNCIENEKYEMRDEKGETEDRKKTYLQTKLSISSISKDAILSRLNPYLLNL